MNSLVRWFIIFFNDCFFYDFDTLLTSLTCFQLLVLIVTHQAVSIYLVKILITFPELLVIRLILILETSHFVEYATIYPIFAWVKAFLNLLDECSLFICKLGELFFLEIFSITFFIFNRLIEQKLVCLVSIHVKRFAHVAGHLQQWVICWATLVEVWNLIGFEVID